MKLEFRLLGDIAVVADGQPLGLGGTRQRSVLALLVLQRDRPIATELLADRLWPDDQPLSAIKTIQVYVARLRRALGPAADRLHLVGDRLPVGGLPTTSSMPPASSVVSARARESLTPTPAGPPWPGSEETLAHGRAPALGDLAGEQFARARPSRPEELRLQAFEELFELRIAAGSGRRRSVSSVGLTARAARA